MSATRRVFLAASVLGVSLLLLPDYGRCTTKGEVVFEDDDRNKCPPEKPYCVTVAQCPQAVAQVRRGQHPQICDWQKTTSLVCCQEPAGVDLPPSEGSGKPVVPPEPAHPEPDQPEPAEPRPNEPEPDHPGSDKPEPVSPEPVNPEPSHPEPSHPEPANPEPVPPGPANPEPGNPGSANPEPVDPGSVSPNPVVPKPSFPDEEEEEPCLCLLEPDTDDATNAGPRSEDGGDNFLSAPLRNRYHDTETTLAPGIVCGVRHENAESRQGAMRSGRQFDEEETYYLDPRRIFRPRLPLPFRFGRPAPGGFVSGRYVRGRYIPGHQVPSAGLTGRLATRARQTQQEHPSWPWMVSIIDQANTARRCAGVLLDIQHVLTAAQCFGPDGGAQTVAELNMPGEPSVHRVVSVVPHPAYQSPDGYNDLAVVRLVPPITPGTLSPICLPQVLNARGVLDGSLVDAVSWSNRQQDFHPGSMAEKRFRILPVATCNKTYAGVDLSPYPLGVSKDEFLCAEVQKVDREECVGLPGSPLMVKEKNLWTIVGIYSFGVSCGATAHYPTVFTRITPYVSWINEVLGVRR